MGPLAEYRLGQIQGAHVVTDLGFVKFDRKVLHTKAVTGLSDRAFRVLHHMLDKFTGYNNGELWCSYAEIEDLCRCSTASVKRAFNELKAAGLIELVKRASFDHKAGARRGMSNVWRITFVKNLSHKTNGTAQNSEAGNAFDGVPGDQ